ncbi:MAG: thiamine pyrophosphate-dependent enzyme, partial [Gaiellaceae bacterium]
GVFHESLNLAAVWDVPLIAVVENNQYTQYSPYEVLTAGGDISERARGYGLPQVKVDGQDIEAVYEVAQQAIQRARDGDGPSLIDVETYRFHGHHEGEEQILGVNVYRSLDEIAKEQEERDPVQLARRRASDAGVTDGTLTAIEAEAAGEIERAVEFAESSPAPDLDAALADVFAGS